jgi:hypothetical protein
VPERYFISVFWAKRKRFGKRKILRRKIFVLDVIAGNKE